LEGGGRGLLQPDIPALEWREWRSLGTGGNSVEIRTGYVPNRRL